MPRRAMRVMVIHVVVVRFDVMEPGPVMRRRQGGCGG
jgi:hypothetical protein